MGDESRHNGAGIWKLKNVESLTYQSGTITLNETPVLTFPFIRLLEGVQNRGRIIPGQNGWFGDSSLNDNSYYTAANHNAYNFFSTPDVYFYGGLGSDKKIARKLPTAGKNWQLETDVFFTNGIVNGMFSPGSILYLKIYDNTGKTICTIEARNKDYGQYGHPSQLAVNGAAVYEQKDPFAVGPLKGTWQHLSLKIVSGHLQASFAGNTATVPIGDNAANLFKPAVFSIETNGHYQPRDIDLYNLNFIP